MIKCTWITAITISKYSGAPLNNHPWCKDTLSRKATLLCPKVAFLVQIYPWDKDTSIEAKSSMVAFIERFHCSDSLLT